MKLSSDINSQDYHAIVRYVKDVTIDGERVPNVVSVDVDAGKAVCMVLPLVVKRGEIETYVKKGKIAITWRVSGVGKLVLRQTPFGQLYKDWYKRERPDEYES